MDAHSCIPWPFEVVDASPRRYLEGHILQAEAPSGGEVGFGDLDSFGPLLYVISNLRVKLVSPLQPALLALPDNNMK